MNKPKHISEINFKVGNERSFEPRKIVIDEETKKIVNYIFKRLKGIIPAFNVTAADEEELGIIKNEWALGFIQSGLSDLRMIELGLDRLRLQENTFMISIGQFIKLCRPTPEDLGIPSLEKSYEEACRRSHPFGDTDWSKSHKVVYHAWKQTGSHMLANFPKENSFPVFERNYQATVNMLLDGKELEDIPLAISHGIDRAITTKSVGMSHLAALKKILG